MKQNYLKDVQQESEFVENLPLSLKQELSKYIYKEVYSSVDFLKTKKALFISWICPLLKSIVTSPKEFIFYEGDIV